MSWALTVAAIVEREGRYLVVEERDPGRPGLVLNQPAGHVDPGESLLDAVVRETREETGLAFTPRSLVGVYQLRAANGKDYCRVCFEGTVPEGADAAPEDPEILGCRWMSREELAAAPLRSGLVLACLEDYLKGQRLPLEAVGVFRTER